MTLEFFYHFCQISASHETNVFFHRFEFSLWKVGQVTVSTKKPALCLVSLPPPIWSPLPLFFFSPSLSVPVLLIFLFYLFPLLLPPPPPQSVGQMCPICSNPALHCVVADAAGQTAVEPLYTEVYIPNRGVQQHVRQLVQPPRSPLKLLSSPFLILFPTDWLARCGCRYHEGRLGLTAYLMVFKKKKKKWLRIHITAVHLAVLTKQMILPSPTPPLPTPPTQCFSYTFLFFSHSWRL